MAQFLNNAEGGSNTTTVTTLNSGGTSGDAFTSVTIAAGGGLTFSNTHAAHGTLAYNFTTDVTGESVTVGYVLPGVVNDFAFRFYGYFTANPASVLTLLSVRSGATQRVRMTLSTAGKLAILGNTGTDTMATAIPLNQWFRVELTMHVTAVSPTFSLTRYDTMDSVTATDTKTQSLITIAADGIDRMLFGVTSAIASQNFWTDDIGFNNTGTLFGPAVTVVNASIAQVAATVTATGGTQTIATVNNVAISQVAGTVTASGGTQSVATVNNVAISQVGGVVTASGGTQVISTPGLSATNTSNLLLLGVS